MSGIRVPGAWNDGLEGAVFTGIITELGKVAGLERLDGSARLTIDGPQTAADSTAGGSIAVNGVCLTVTHASGGQFSADVMGETLARSTLGSLRTGGRVNLERPVQAGGRLDGHIVQGHVDGTGVIADRRMAGSWEVVRIAIPPELARYIAQKGSVAVDGVSLTVSALSDAGSPATEPAGLPPVVPRTQHQGDWFEVSLIPETLARTTLGALAVGEQVNLEVDVIAKYVERLVRGVSPGQALRVVPDGRPPVTMLAGGEGDD